MKSTLIRVWVAGTTTTMDIRVARVPVRDEMISLDTGESARVIDVALIEVWRQQEDRPVAHVRTTALTRTEWP